MLSLSGTLVDSQTKQPVEGAQVALSGGDEVALAQGQKIAVAQGVDVRETSQIAVVTTDGNGAWNFEAAAGHDYIVRMPSQFTALPSPEQEQGAEGAWVFGGHLVRNLSESVGDIVLEAEFYPAVERTPERDADYIAQILRAALLGFEEQTKNVDSFDEVTKALDEAKTTLDQFLSLFGGLKLYVPCATCQSRCYGNPDPQCIYKCIYLPVHCY